jgi:hypothetical protein
MEGYMTVEEGAIGLESVKLLGPSSMFNLLAMIDSTMVKDDRIGEIRKGIIKYLFTSETRLVYSSDSERRFCQYIDSKTALKATVLAEVISPLLVYKNQTLPIVLNTLFLLIAIYPGLVLDSKLVTKEHHVLAIGIKLAQLKLKYYDDNVTFNNDGYKVCPLLLQVLSTQPATSSNQELLNGFKLALSVTGYKYFSEARGCLPLRLS